MRVYQKSQDKLAKASESLDTAKSKGQLKKGEKLREKSGLASKKALQSRNEYGCLPARLAASPLACPLSCFPSCLPT